MSSVPAYVARAAAATANATATATATAAALPAVGVEADQARNDSLIIAGVFSLLAVLLSTWGIYRHFRAYRRPDLQRRIIRILFMVPIYAIDSWFSLRFIGAAIYLDTARDCYEAFVLYQFFVLLVQFVGGEAQLRHTLISYPPMDHPWPFNYCLPKIMISHPRFFGKMQRGILQFTLLKPVLAAIKIIMVACGVYDDGDLNPKGGYLYISLIDNVSISISLYCLVLFYMATKEELKPYRPVSKFICIKAVIFFSFWQGFIIAGLVRIKVIHDVGDWTSENVATGAQDFLICIEMFLAAVAHLYAFSSKEYESMMSSTLPFRHALRDVFSIREDVGDTRAAFNIRGGGKNTTYAQLVDESFAVDERPLELEFTDEDPGDDDDYREAKAMLEGGSDARPL